MPKISAKLRWCHPQWRQQRQVGYVKCKCGNWKLATFDTKHCQLSLVASWSHWASISFVCSTFAVMQHVTRVCQRQLILVCNDAMTVVTYSYCSTYTVKSCCYALYWKFAIGYYVHLNATFTTTRICFTALCPGQPGWASTRRNIHPPTILIIIQSLSASSICYDSIASWMPLLSHYFPGYSICDCWVFNFCDINFLNVGSHKQCHSIALVSDIAIFVLKRGVKLQLTN